MIEAKRDGCEGCVFCNLHGYEHPCKVCKVTMISGTPEYNNAIDFYETDEVKINLCKGCKHSNKNPNTIPCNECNTAGNYGRYYTPEPVKDNVNHPAHYQGKNECIDVMVAMFGVEAVKAFCKCNAYKYRFRANAKNGAEDIQKAEWYETKLIELEGANCE